MRIEIEAAPGEYFDKLTILEIKLKKITDKNKLIHIQKEWNTLTKSNQSHRKLNDISDNEQKAEKLEMLVNELRKINEQIWDIEDTVRQCELDQDFGDGFIQAARSVYLTNDKRAALKKEINILLDSDIMEEKSYTEYQKGN